MKLKNLQQHWDAFGKTDPLWAILSDPQKRGNRWDLDEFFRTGVEAVDALMAASAEVFPGHPKGSALDFGCGAGRLTQGLARHFEKAVGVDIAPSMVDLANRYNRHGDRCQYVLNGADDLRVFPDARFDFILSLIVLQHMEPLYSQRYLHEFMRILRPGGLLVFQIPSEPRTTTTSTRASGPLPADGFRGTVRILEAPATVGAGVQAEVRAAVTNTSPVPWPGQGFEDGRLRINLGNHWLDAAGKIVRHDDGRGNLPKDLAPGETAEIAVTVTAPSQPGRYTLEFDLVQEFVAWFKDRGSATALAGVEVVAQAAPPPSAATPEPPPLEAPRMEMYGVRKSDILALVSSCGGRVIRADDDRSAGQEWVSYVYWVTR